MVDESLPDLILTDISLPGKSGLDVMRYARSIDDEVAVILMTGYASVQTAIDALRQGADDYVTKPFEDIAELPVMIEKRLRNRRLRAENRALLERLKRHEQELRERVERATWQLRSLYRVNIEIGADLGLEPRLQRIAESTATLMGARAAIVYLRQEDTGEYRAAAAYGVALAASGEAAAPVIAGVGSVGLAAFNRSPVHRGAPDGATFAVSGTDERARTLLAVPLPQGDESLGVLVALERPEGFGANEE